MGPRAERREHSGRNRDARNRRTGTADGAASGRRDDAGGVVGTAQPGEPGQEARARPRGDDPRAGRSGAAAGAGGDRDQARFAGAGVLPAGADRSEEHTSELQSLMRISYAVFCLKTKSRNNLIAWIDSM